MNLRFRHRRWVWRVVTLAAVLALAGLAPQLGFTKPARGPLWTEHPIFTTPTTSGPARSWVELAKGLKPAVVNISTKRVQEGMPQVQSPFGPDDPFEQFFQQFFGDQPRRMVRSLGSGFTINPKGYIVTNNHVVDGATEIHVKLSDGRELPAKVVGRDSKTDLALLKIEASNLPVIPLGDSSELQVGEPVMAIGNPFGLEQTVTTGIVSATGRVIGEGPYDDFIQTDASINPGNSGGPLINTRGQAIGINTAIFSQSGGSVGIGFSIPIDLAKSVLVQLAGRGRVVRGWLGVTIQPLTPALANSFNLPDPSGALVSSVVDGSPAMDARVKPGDVITAYNGRKLSRSEDLPRAVAETPVGQEVPLTVVRKGKRLTLTAKIGQRREPDHQAMTKAEASLGLAVQSLTPALGRQLGLANEHGVLVRGVEQDSPAASAGIQPGDIIVEVDHYPVTTVRELKQTVDRHRKGIPILFLVHRNGGNLYVAVAA
ncbi:MAG: DegQ family serine endoprotease [Candidatus Methylomirabilia bacterium]